jgi:hypothetical protein
MNSRRIGRITALATIATLALPATSLAALRTATPRPRTGSATHILTSSALLTGSVVVPTVHEQKEITYWFEYGRTSAYGSQTAATPLPATSTSTTTTTRTIKLGQAVKGLLPASEYHFALVVSWAGAPKPVVGPEKRFSTKGAAPSFDVPRTAQATYGLPFTLSGGLLGTKNASHPVVLEASPFPYLEPFTPIGASGLTNSVGRFAFRVSHLTVSTQLRLTTTDPLPVYSRIITVSVAPRVTLHVRRSSSGLVRLYGTIVPAVHGATVVFQVEKAVRPGKSEVTTRFVSQFETKPRKSSGNSMRFSLVTRVRHGGLYRAYVRLHAGGALTSGTSSTVLVHKS